MATTTSLRVFVPGDEAAADVLGVWQVAPGDGGATVWEVDLTAGAAQARALLQDPAWRVAAAGRALPAADSRLSGFIRRGPGQTPSFAAPAPGLRAPEQRLAAWMAPEIESFALGGLGEKLEQALGQATGFARQVRRSLGQPALVRSRAAGRPLGQTRVSWTGDVSTAWPPGLGQDETALHEEAVRLALATLQSWMRITALVGASAVQLSLLLPTGIGAIRALPAAWEFVTAIIAEYQRLRRLS